MKNYTMTGAERINGLIEAKKHIIRKKIDGAFVECGVWKGGSVMAMALTLKERGEVSEISLYDTSSGMYPLLKKLKRIFFKQDIRKRNVIS